MNLLDKQGLLLGRVSVVDALMAIFLLPLALLPYYSLQIIGHRALGIYTVSPKRFTPGVDKTLALTVSGVDSESTARIADFPFQNVDFVNEAHLNILVPLEVGSGMQSVYVKNTSGRVVMFPNAFEVVWKPMIQRIRPERIPLGEKATVEISGRYFEAGCTVSLGELPLWVESASPTLLQVQVPPLKTPGWFSLHVTNPNGMSGQGKEAVGVFLRPGQPEIVKVLPRKIRSHLPGYLRIVGKNFKPGCTVAIGGIPLKEIHWVSSRFLKVSVPAYEMEPGLQRVTLLNPDGVKAQWQDGLYVSGRSLAWVVVEVYFNLSEKEAKNLKGIPGWRRFFKKNFNVNRFRTHVLLKVEMESAGSDPTFFYRGAPLTVGSWVDLRVRNGTFGGVVTSRPIPVAPSGELSP